MAFRTKWLLGVTTLALLVCGTTSIRWLEVGLQYQREFSTPQTDIKALKASKIKPIGLKEQTLSTIALNKRQRKLLRQIDGLYPVLQRSAARTISTCQAAFNESRWNCSSLNHLPEISPELNSGTREQAYVYALSSALLTIDVARACASGVIKGCPCQTKRKKTSKGTSEEGFVTDGCALSYKPGLRIAQRFINAGLKGRTKGTVRGNNESTWTKRHNSHFGAQAVARAMEKKCKCHGLSGSCEMITCWKGVNEQTLLTELKEKYNSALALVQQRTADDGEGGGHGKRDLQDENIKELIFNKISSDYCNPDPLTGSYGTRSRECGGPEKNNCGWMCCGRGYTEKTVTRVERCRCKHVWCCYVQCDTCTVTTTTYYCK